MGGRNFGSVGAYEQVEGKIFFAVDPKNPLNASIADIQRAPRNGQGKVEFSSDFYMIKPKAESRGNGTLLFEVSNRGNKGLLGTFNRANRSLNPGASREAGDGFLMEQGFTLFWVGWEFDVPEGSQFLRLYAPAATESGKPIRGPVRTDFHVGSKVFNHQLAVGYVAADPNNAKNVLTERDSLEGERQVIPRQQWKFGKVDSQGKYTDDNRSVYLQNGFMPGKIYELVYISENPPVVGLGLAGIRDAVSYLKTIPSTPLSTDASAIKRSIAFGVSQSGRLLRTFLYFGFNEDLNRRKVFDGLIAHVAGGGQGNFNQRFAQETPVTTTVDGIYNPTDLFPFTDIEQRDPETGGRDGLLTHYKDASLLPRIFYTNSSHEYWGRAASLIHTTIDGKEDARLLDNVRIYLFAGGSHGVAAFPPQKGIGEQLANPLDYSWAQRNLLVRMQRWLIEGAAPPPSAYPRIADKMLVGPEQVKFPNIPGVTRSTQVYKAHRLDFGPQFRKEGISTQEPPRVGAAFPILVSQADEDGNDKAGIRLPELAVPLATYTGWNVLDPKIGLKGSLLVGLQGGFIPLARTRAQREKGGDPRRSIEERYASKEQYLQLIEKSANDLVKTGYLLAADVPEIVAFAGKEWGYLAGPVPAGQ
jgi:hypothetical protein